jgi:predicted DNA-binding protein
MKILTSFRIEKDIHEKMKSIIAEEGMTMQGFIRKAILKLINEFKNINKYE